MLVLSRTIGESVVIDGNVKITVEEVKGGRVQLTIEAPDEVRVMRQEIWTAGSTEGEDDSVILE